MTTIPICILARLSDVDFDRSYILSQVAGHMLTLGALQAGSDDGADPAVKKAARKWVPTTESHLQLAVDLTQHIGGDSPVTSGVQ